MNKDNKIIYFNDVVNRKKVSNLKLFSGSLKKNKYKLFRRFLPYMVGAPLFLGIMHYGCGFSLDQGKIMQEYSFEYDGYNNLRDDELIYRGPWSKNENCYSRIVKIYNAESLNKECIHDVLINKEKKIDSLYNYLVDCDNDTYPVITSEEKIFNNSTMEYVDYDKNESKHYVNVGMSGVAFYVFGYSVLQLLGSFAYNKLSDIVEDIKIRKKVK